MLEWIPDTKTFKVIIPLLVAYGSFAVGVGLGAVNFGITPPFENESDGWLAFGYACAILVRINLEQRSTSQANCNTLVAP
jgi:hypothetical protein